MPTGKTSRMANLQPDNISLTGLVTFTDGTNTGLIGNRQTCEAYGYTFDSASGSCRLNQQHQVSLNSQFNQETNKITGERNRIESGVIGTFMSGSTNLIKSQCSNNLTTGSENITETRINNSAVFGINGKATRQTEFVIGGGANTHTFTCDRATETIYTDKQMSVVELSGGTCGRDSSTLTVNGDGTNYITVRNNSIIGYEVYLTRLELGGTGGTAGNYSYRHLRGSVNIDNAYSMTFSTLIGTTIGEMGGIAGSSAMIDTSTTDIKSISLQVTDRPSVVNQWSAIVYLHEVISTVTTF
tara:strand:+ start:931 stop:1827 length:897 start_codon:yes stop_codon:yes gene_type:complete